MESDGNGSVELRCEAKLHGEIIDGQWYEVRCRSRFCGYRPGVVVLHRFNLSTGTRTTQLYRDPLVAARKEVRIA